MTLREANIARPARKQARKAVAAEADIVPDFAEYLRDSQRPLTCLAVVLPLIAFYELGIAWAEQINHGRPPTHILAFVMLRDALANLGASGMYLPAAGLIGTLLASHIIRGDPWRLEARTITGMAAEAITWALPILAMGFVVAQFFPLAASTGPIETANPQDSLFYWIVLSVGAGVYEELAFRVVAFVALGWLLIDGLRLRRSWAISLTVGLSALCFSLYHYWGVESFHAQTFVFRTMAGIFFGVLYLNRGIGITIATHAFYDVLLQIMRRGGS